MVGADPDTPESEEPASTLLVAFLEFGSLPRSWAATAEHRAQCRTVPLP